MPFMENSAVNPNIILMRSAPRRATLYFKWRFPRGEDKEETTRLFFMSTPSRPIPLSQSNMQPPKRCCHHFCSKLPSLMCLCIAKFSTFTFNLQRGAANIFTVNLQRGAVINFTVNLRRGAAINFTVNLQEVLPSTLSLRLLSLASSVSPI